MREEEKSRLENDLQLLCMTVCCCCEQLFTFMHQAGGLVKVQWLISTNPMRDGDKTAAFLDSLIHIAAEETES